MNFPETAKYFKNASGEWAQNKDAAIQLDSVVPIFEVQLHSSVTNSGSSA
jgi:hypothetical protein